MNNLLFKRKGGIDGEVEEGVVAADVYLIENRKLKKVGHFIYETNVWRCSCRVALQCVLNRCRNGHPFWMQ